MSARMLRADEPKLVDDGGAPYLELILGADEGCGGAVVEGPTDGGM